MKRLTIIIASALAACALSACGIDTQSSLKELTRPYIAQYECTYATLGGKDILKDYDYIRVSLTDSENMVISYKPKGEKQHSQTGSYSYNDKTGELDARLGILGINYRQSVIIENGKFTLSLPIAGDQLVMRFES